MLNPNMPDEIYAGQSNNGDTFWTQHELRGTSITCAKNRQPTKYIRKDKAIPEGYALVPIDTVASLLWRIDYPHGGCLVKTWEDNSFKDKQIYRGIVISAAQKKESE